MLEGVGRCYTSGRSLIIRVPKDVACDSAFPFCKKEAVVVQIVNGEIRVVSREKREREIADIMSKQ